MRMPNLLKLLFIGFLTNAGPSAAVPQQIEYPEQQVDPSLAKPNPEDLKHGAVLCSWAILQMIQQVGDACYPQQDKELRSALDGEIARIDKFIMDNAPMTPDELEALRKKISQMIPGPTLICSKESRQFYERMQDWGIKKMHEGVTGLLSVPRKPQINPCL